MVLVAVAFLVGGLLFLTGCAAPKKSEVAPAAPPTAHEIAVLFDSAREGYSDGGVASLSQADAAKLHPGTPIQEWVFKEYDAEGGPAFGQMKRDTDLLTIPVMLGDVEVGTMRLTWSASDGWSVGEVSPAGTDDDYVRMLKDALGPTAEIRRVWCPYGLVVFGSLDDTAAVFPDAAPMHEYPRPWDYSVEVPRPGKVYRGDRLDYYLRAMSK